MDCSTNDDQVTETSCIFSCDPGYELAGSSTTDCLPNSTWNHPQPSCVIRHCYEYTPPRNTYLMGSSKCPTVFGSECEVDCIDGYRHVKGSATVQKCIWDNSTETVRFSEPSMECERKYITIPLGNGTIIVLLYFRNSCL